MKLENFLELLECEDPDLDVLFDVKDVEGYLDFVTNLILVQFLDLIIPPDTHAHLAWKTAFLIFKQELLF